MLSLPLIFVFVFGIRAFESVSIFIEILFRVFDPNHDKHLNIFFHLIYLNLDPDRHFWWKWYYHISCTIHEVATWLWSMHQQQPGYAVHQLFYTWNSGKNTKDSIVQIV